MNTTLNTTFVSGAYRPEEDARNAPKRSIEQICADAQRIRARRRSLKQSYRTRSMQNPVEMAGIRKATNRMVGERE